MLFPVSGVEVHPALPFLVALVISFFTSMGGVSGAFLLLPFQVSVLGFTSPAVSPTNLVFNIVAIPSGVYRYIREGRMAWPLTWVVIVGTLPGVFIGAWLRITYLPDPRAFKLFAGFVLFYIGVRLLYDLWRPRPGMKALEVKFNERVAAMKQARQSRVASGLPPAAVVRPLKFTPTRIAYEFYGETFEFSTWGIFALSFVVGIVGGTYGIGGGAIVAPFFVAVFGLPVYTVAGAALMGTFITSVAGVLFYVLIAPYYPQQAIAPDWLLGLLFGLGGMAGMYLGARTQKFVPARIIKIILATILLYLAGTYIIGFYR
ncbi:MAG: sulfite exporter TauE/SafE family protein [Desulfobacca sp.]|uniref:sulfite exporter TauE/SafE family protein n=1 Tax=Desulfobacca sp. TaxID=2067990 RepID=UPI0040499323